jgi:hypothetical protein
MTIQQKIMISCFVSILAGVQAVSAAEKQKLKVSGGLALSNKNMELIIRDRQFTPEFTSLALSLTGGIGNFYLTFNHDQSIKDDIEADSAGLIFYSRRDSSLALSYVLSRQWRLSAGYRAGETESFYTVSNDEFGTSEEGFFVGGNFSYSFGKKGTASTSLAIAQLDGEVSLREPFVDTSAFVVGSPPPQNIEGDALGYSFGLAWTDLITERTRYSVGLRIHRYDFEDTQVYGGLDLSYQLNFNSLYFGLTHSFN